MGRVVCVSIYYAAAIVARVSASTCYGTRREYDSQCLKFTTHHECAVQPACRWGDSQKDHCFAIDPTDSSMVKSCGNRTNESACDALVGCAWQSVSDVEAWKKSVSDSVAALDAATTQEPSSISFSVEKLASCHDHQQTDATKLNEILDAWKTKYSVPDEALSALRGLVAAESVDFRGVHVVLDNGDQTISEVAAGGRRYNGEVSLAFVYGTGSGSLVKYPKQSQCQQTDYGLVICHNDGTEIQRYGTALCCSGCDHIVDCAKIPSSRALDPSEASFIKSALQHSLFSNVSAEATLLESELSGMHAQSGTFPVSDIVI